MNEIGAWQAAGQSVEQKMMDFLLQFAPAAELKVCDVQAIARFARSISFDNFSKLRPEK